MSITSDFTRWQSGCVNGTAEGVTAGDTMHLGLRSYSQEYPCPNGLEVRNEDPSGVPAWRNRIDKARKDIAEHREHIAWKTAVDESHQTWLSDDISRLIKLSEGLYE